MYIHNKKFMIAAYVAPPPPCEKNLYDKDLMERGYRLAREAGFSTCYGYYEKWPEDTRHVMQALDLAYENGLDYLLTDSRFGKKSGDISPFELKEEPYAAHPGFLGHMVWDEPGRRDFEKLYAMQERYEQAFGDKLFYVNLQPIYSPAHYLKNGMWTQEMPADYSYENYLEEYLSIVRPRFLSFDFYPFRVEGFAEDYYNQLSTIRRLAKKHRIPFWVYIQSCTWNTSEALLPTTAQLMWQVHTSVAYGAAGIQYFCFFTPYSNSPENYNVAMVDFYGEPTALYHAACRANWHIRAVENELADAEHIGILKSGTGPAGVPLCDRVYCEVVHSMQGDLLGGVFVKKNQLLLYLVSDRTETQPQAVQLNFFRELSYSVLKEGQQEHRRDSRYIGQLNGGEALFFKLDISCAEYAVNRFDSINVEEQQNAKKQ